MNKRQKKKNKRTYNRKLLSRYPFMAPRNVWSGKLVEGYDYSWTDYDCIDPGWQKAFGTIMLEELREALIKNDYLNHFYFYQIKEKYGSLRLYSSPAPKEIFNILHKYEFISHYICCRCGKLDVPIVDVRGWYQPICKQCYGEVEKRYQKYYKYGKLTPYEELFDTNEDYILPSCYVIDYLRDKESVDISETVNKIRERQKKWKSKDQL